MKFPTPDPTEYGTTILVVLATLAVLEYVGLFSEGSGTVDVPYLVGVGLLLPVAMYLISLTGANVAWIPEWNELNRE
ncbi:hypothetical protein [Halovivax limisalsi]|uniref:hypothetical protein n=1 Tax=Halovivax limisalsi TaxID=1453760 RepID=UPI001FFD5CA8|nr:hypothetical protein [Halovivax limisalsi]